MSLVEAIARAMRNSKAWPAVFNSGSAEELARACLEAIEREGYEIKRKSVVCDHKHYRYEKDGRRCTCGELMVDWGD